MSTSSDLQPYLDRLHELGEYELTEVHKLVGALNKSAKRDKAQAGFMDFIYSVWPNFIHGKHHEIMARAFDRVAQGKLKRLIVNMPPRHTKSEFASHMLPAWYMGKFPDRKIIQASHTADLAKDFGKKVKDLIDDDLYQKVFPTMGIKKDDKAAGRWKTNEKGEYYAVGVEGNIAGRGADLFIIDDPHSEQTVAANEKVSFQKVYDWYTSGPRQRLQPDAAIVIVMTRWHKGDLTGKILDKAKQDGELGEWEVIELPAIMENGNALWPEFWSVLELEKLKKELPRQKWQAQYMQNPTAQESSIIKREWWKEWQEELPPKCEFVMQSWDTGYLKTETADPSAFTEWGIFYMEGPTGRLVPNLILLDAYKERLEFPELKQEAWRRYNNHQPDTVLVEAKSSGLPLIQELRSRGIPIQEFTPTRGNDKIARVNAVSDLFSSGVIWYPKGKTFAEDVIEEFSEFPVGDHDDLVDSSTQALLRFRKGGFLPLESDYDIDDDFEPIRANYY